MAGHEIEARAIGAGPWTASRTRAATLRRQHPHAAEMMHLYHALTEAWADVASAMAADPPPADGLPGYVAAKSMPLVLERTLAAGPDRLRAEALRRYHEADPAELVAGWLADVELPATERYLARASAGPVLEAQPELAGRVGTPASDPRHCPGCGGLPQLSFFGLSDEPLVAAHRRLLCSRCAGTWTYPRMVCAGCGNEDTARLPIYSDPELFAHLRVDACEACGRYLVTVDLPKDPAAVPVVDELLALPLDLYARERGFQKITPNLMGF